MPSEEEERRRRYVEQERREQRERSRRGRTSQDIGRWFHYGIAEMRGETPDRGWQHEVPQQLASGRRIHDAGRAINQYEFREYKGARRLKADDFTLKQIKLDREALTIDKRAMGAWIVIEGAPDQEIRKALDDMVRDFGDRFRVEEVTQEQARQAKKLGRELERSREQQQPELFKSSELRAKERIREVQKKAAERERTRAAAKEALEKQERERQIREEQQRQREAVDRVAERVRLDREAAARGEHPAMTGHEAADILRINRPPPGVESPFREPPQPTRGGRDAPGRGRDRGVERGR
ncbi:hypothetical protein ABZV91_31215 [Nocardia sp. NPDC004568]|uniref:hypothetical protein n=1 Tax=Nocardia sp. NPDC004568 TaxID=3154551 RepID=UPI0033A18CD7